MAVAIPKVSEEKLMFQNKKQSLAAPRSSMLSPVLPKSWIFTQLPACAGRGQVIALGLDIQWTLANPNSLGPEAIQISEIFGLVKATAATCVIVTAPYLHSVLGYLGSLPLLHFTEHTTLLPSNLLALC